MCLHPTVHRRASELVHGGRAPTRAAGSGHAHGPGGARPGLRRERSRAVRALRSRARCARRCTTSSAARSFSLRRRMRARAEDASSSATGTGSRAGARIGVRIGARVGAPVGVSGGAPVGVSVPCVCSVPALLQRCGGVLSHIDMGLYTHAPREGDLVELFRRKR